MRRKGTKVTFIVSATAYSCICCMLKCPQPVSIIANGILAVSPGYMSRSGRNNDQGVARLLYFNFAYNTW